MRLMKKDMFEDFISEDLRLKNQSIHLIGFLSSLVLVLATKNYTKRITYS